MSRKTLITVAVLAALSSATAFAAAQSAAAPAPKPERGHLDANGDGFIDKTEAAKSPRLSEKFMALDKNKDGRLAKEELPDRGDRKHRRGHGPREALARLDTDQDGRISRAESAAGGAPLAARFEQMDVNNDGFIDRTDHELRAKQRRDEWFAGADTDKDGKLSRAEFDAAKSKHGERGPRPPAK